MLSHNHNKYYEHNFSGTLKFTECNSVIGVHHIADSLYMYSFIIGTTWGKNSPKHCYTQKKS